MIEHAQSELRPRLWQRWLAGLLCLCLLAGFVRLIYPAIRQRQLVAELGRKNFSVSTQPLFDDKWPRWIRRPLASNFVRYVEITDNVTPHTDAEMLIIEKLVGLTYDGFTQPAGCGIGLTAPGCAITDLGLSYLKGLRQIQWLHLGSTHITDEGMAHLARLTNLQQLEIDSPLVTDVGLKHLHSLSRLTDLTLKSPLITDGGLTHLKSVVALEFLTLETASITDSGLSELSHLPKLRGLNLKGTEISDAGIPLFGRLKSLEQLNVAGTRLSPKGVAKLRALLPMIKVEGP